MRHPTTSGTVPITVCPQSGEYLAAVLKLDPSKIADIAAELGLSAQPRGSANLCIADSDEPLLDAWRRLCELADRPDEIPFMAPLIEREILFRLLRGPQRDALARLAAAEPGAQRIRVVAAWIRAHLAEPVVIDDLAEKAHMSVSVFHRRFKETMRMSPLQYQKTLRLYEARSRLSGARRDAAGVAYSVGYESASQFSREYKRQFGISPSEECSRMASSL